MSILLIGDFSAHEYATWRTELASNLPRGERLVLACEDFDPVAVEVAVVANPPPRSLTRFPNLRFIQSLWAGVDRLLSDGSVSPEIMLARLVDPAMGQAMVECAIAHVFYLHRQMPQYLRQQAERTWRQLPQPMAAGRSIGVLGLGHLGSAVARALAGLGFRLLGWSLTQRDVNEIEAYFAAEGLREMLARSEYLINLLPLTPQTRGILNASLFAQLPMGAAIVNLGRGAHMVDEDLLAALDSGRIRHAVLDVFNEEPLPPEHPFWSHPRITVLPHVAADTDPHTAARIACDNIAAFRAGRPVSGLVSRSRGY